MPPSRPLSTAASNDVTALVEAHLRLVDKLVRERVSKVPPCVSREDLQSAGQYALTLAARSFEPDRGVPFAHYAAIRIRGAITDELRGLDWATRSVRSRAREIDTAVSDLAGRLERTPQPQDIATELQLSIEELSALRADIARANVLSLEDLTSSPGSNLAAEPSGDPEAVLLRRERLGYLLDAIAELPDRLRRVVIAYFFEERQMSQIGAEFGVTQARASQLCAEALLLLRDGINAQLDPASVRMPIQSKRTAAAREYYLGAVAGRSTLDERLSCTTVFGDMVMDARSLDASESSLIA